MNRNPEDSTIYPFYLDYVQWCDANGIHPECWEVFYNECAKRSTHRSVEMQRWNAELNQRRVESLGRIDPEEYRRQNPRPMDRHQETLGQALTRIHRQSQDLQNEVRRRMTPLTPDDEQRAVAEAMRIMGATK